MILLFHLFSYPVTRRNRLRSSIGQNGDSLVPLTIVLSRWILLCIITAPGKSAKYPFWSSFLEGGIVTLFSPNSPIPWYSDPMGMKNTSSSTHYVLTRIWFCIYNREKKKLLLLIRARNVLPSQIGVQRHAVQGRYESTVPPSPWRSRVFPDFCFSLPKVWYSFSGPKATIRMLGSRMKKGWSKGGAKRKHQLCLRFTHLCLKCHWLELHSWEYLGEREAGI